LVIRSHAPGGVISRLTAWFCPPEFRRAVCAARENTAAVQRKGDRADLARVPLESAEHPASPGVPDLERPIRTAGDNVPAIGEEGDRAHGPRMALVALSGLFQHAEQLAGPGLPHLRRAV